MDMPNDPKAPDREVVERVVTWHNRLPGARRIEAHHVTGIGIVALPFAAALQPPTTGRRVLRRLWHAPEHFTEPLIESIRAARAAAFGWQHGAAIRPGPDRWPLRKAALVGDLATEVQWRFLRTAAVEFGPRRIRVLIGGSGAQAPVLGARHWNPQRLRAMLVAAAMVIVAACGSALFVRHERASAAHPISEPSGPGELARGGVLAASAAGSASASASASASIAAPTSGADSSDSGRGAQSAVTPGATRAISDSDRSASASASARSASTAPLAESVQKPATPSPGRPGPWSLATQPTRNRAATELRILLINSSASPRGGAVRVEAVQTPNGWRAVLGPFASREAAEQTRESLRAQGVQLEPIGF